MKLLVGLGNPGPRYEVTRHNIGFLAIDRLVDKLKARPIGQKYLSDAFEVEYKREKLLLLKPQTFMNLSGKAVGEVFRFFKLAPSDLIVFHDELDLDPDVLRLKVGGGNGGHNGLKSIDQAIGAEANDYIRFRLGIGHPRRNPDEKKRGMSPADYVLESFSQAECDKLDAFLDKVSEASLMVLEGKVKEAMNQFHTTPKEKQDD